ncbi:MAG: glycosyltransferase family 4 protein [Prolixibacteraceae bacterium]|nr:glycosyltransferase family 4 protein [Prolixibacteraceae bacterium]
MNILFVTDYFYPHIGGVEKLFQSLTEKLSGEGHRVTYVTWRYSKGLPKTENYKGINIIRIHSFSRFFFSVVALPKIMQQAKTAGIIHTSTYSSALGTRLAALLTRTKAVITVHEAWGKIWNELPFISPVTKWLFRLLEKSMLNLKFDKYIAVSESTRDQLITAGINPEKIEVIHNGIDNHFPKWKKPDGPFTFCYFGRAGISKGLDLLLPAFEALLKDNENIRLKIIASPQSKRVFRFLQEYAQKDSLKDQIELMSNLPRGKLLSEITSCHCVVIPSYSEGFGFTAAEASAMGIPIISSGRGSLPEVAYGKVITMEKQTAISLKNAMKKALDNEFEDVPEKKFTVEEFVTKHLSLYSKLV